MYCGIADGILVVGCDENHDETIKQVVDIPEDIEK